MESVLRKAQVHHNGTIFLKRVQLLAHADDIDIMGHTKWDVTATFSAIERPSSELGLAVNESKTKYILSTSRDMLHIGYLITGDNYTINIVKNYYFHQKWCQSVDHAYDHSCQ